MSDEVVIGSRFEPDNANKGIDELLGRLDNMKQSLNEMENGSATNAVQGFELSFTAVAGAAAIATTAVVAFVGATVAGLQECISTAIELEEKWNNFDKENRFSTIMGDFNEAYDDLKASIGQEFIPGLKDSIQGMTFLVDKTKEGVDYIKSQWGPISSILSINPLTGISGGAAFGVAGLAFKGAAAFSDNTSDAQKEREARRAEDEEVGQIQRQMERDVKLAQELEREAKQQDREEDRLAIQNRRELEQAERDAKRKEQEELREMERTLDANRRFAGRNKFGGGELNFGGGEQGFASSIESFSSVFNRIQTAAASVEKPEDKIIKVIETEGEARAQQHEEVKLKMDQSIEAMERAATALEKQEVGLA